MSKIIGVRIAAEDRELLEKVCQAKGEDLSDFVRRSIKKEIAFQQILQVETTIP
jgi:uncharacterized protein (DUF1778 family)